jgi:phosphoribosylanthranilate isomerase
MLLDASGGRGIDTPIEILKTNIKVGYAGGINPDNVADKLSFLLEHVNTGEFWIDMESGVRTDDWFDLDKVVKVLGICQQVIDEHQNI